MKSARRITVTPGMKKASADMVFTDAIQFLAEEENISLDEARTRLIHSRAFQGMYDFNTGLWGEGPVYFLWFYRQGLLADKPKLPSSQIS